MHSHRYTVYQLTYNLTIHLISLFEINHYLSHSHYFYALEKKSSTVAHYSKHQQSTLKFNNNGSFILDSIFSFQTLSVLFRMQLETGSPLDIHSQRAAIRDFALQAQFWS